MGAAGQSVVVSEPAGSAPVMHYLGAFRKNRSALPGSGIPWIQRLRDHAADEFSARGFPSMRWEEWKYTDTQPLVKRVFESLPVSTPPTARQSLGPNRLGGLESHRLVFVDGRFAAELSDLGELPRGVVIQSLAEALARHVDVIEAHLARQADVGANPFVALNTMLMSEGAFIHVPAGVKVEAPIHLLYLSTAEGGTSQLRNLILAEESSDATVIEHYSAGDGLSYWVNAVTEVVLSDNAQLEHYKLEEEGDKAFHIATVEVHQARDSRFVSHNAALGGRLVRNDIGTRLNGENAHCVLNGLYVLKGRQHVDNHTRIDHMQPRAVSRELYKGVMDGWSRGVFNGKVIVHKDAQLTDSNQSNHNLLLSPNAEADPKPQLEIFADDVRCTHGATVGQLDEDALYYLRSRGVPAHEARVLLTFAFANDVITRMRLEPVRVHLENLIKTRLPAAEILHP